MINGVIMSICKTKVRQIQINAWECNCFLWVLEKRLRRFNLKEEGYGKYNKM